MAGKNNGKRTTSRGRNPGIAVAVLVLLFILAAGRCYAHRVVVFAWIEGDTVYTESKFPGGSKVSEGDIKVFDDSGQEVLAGKTDRKGEFSFSLKSVPSPSGLKIVLNAGMGHQGYWKLTKAEVSRAMGIETDAGKSTTDSVNPSVVPQAPSDDSLQTGPCRINEAELKKIVEEAVDRKMSPVMEMLIAIREKMAIGLDDVVAGVGYIFGFFGVVAWIYSRKRG